jgi:hypothetical protein
MDPQRDNLNHAKTFRCADCGAVNPVGVSQCFLCGRKFDGGGMSIAPPGGGTNAGDLSTARPSAQGISTYSLSSLFLIVTLAAVCFGLISQAPGLAIPLIVLITPAILNTFIKSRKQQRAGSEFTTGDKIRVFASSVGVVLSVIVAGAVAFLAACFVSCTAMLGTNSKSMDQSLVICLVIGSLFGVIIMIVIARQLWKQIK